MKHIARALALFTVVMALIWVSFGHAHAGSIPLLGAGKPGTAAAAYQGPGDLQPGAAVWGGLNGYSAAVATGSTPAVDLLDQAGANPIVINITTSGDLDVAAIAAWVTANSVTTIKVPRLYDQTGNTRHFTQATLANMPTLVLAGLGSKPILSFAAASSQSLATPGSGVWSGSVSTVSVVATRPTYGGIDNGIVGNDASLAAQFGSANQVKLYNGSVVPGVTAADGAWHSIQFVLNGASSDINVDGTQNTLSPGSGAGAGRLTVGVEPQAGTQMNGSINSIGMWNSVFSPANSSAISSQAHTYWGF